VFLAISSLPAEVGRKNCDKTTAPHLTDMPANHQNRRFMDGH
jgi:hypothetical protein